MNVSPKNPARLGAELSPNQTQIRIRETSRSSSSSGFLDRADRSAAQCLPLCSPVPSVVIAFSVDSKRGQVDGWDALHVTFFSTNPAPPVQALPSREGADRSSVPSSVFPCALCGDRFFDCLKAIKSLERSRPLDNAPLTLYNWHSIGATANSAPIPTKS
jgi:hypothetical protein